MLSILSALCGSQIFYQKIQLTPRTLPVGVCLQGACVCVTDIKWALSCSAPQEMNLTLLIYHDRYPSPHLSALLVFTSSLPAPLSVTPVSSVFLFPPPALLSFWPFQIFFCLLPSVCSISILCRICLILPLCLSSFHHDSTQLSLRTVHSIFSHFPLLFFLPASIALLFCQSSNLLLSIITLCTILLLYLSFKQPCSSAQLFILGLFKCTETSDNMNALAVFFFFSVPESS